MRKTVIAGLIAVGLTATAGWRYGLPAYRHFVEQRSLRMCQDFMRKADYQNAFLSARQVLAQNSTNLEVCRIMAELNEISRSPAAVIWRRKVTDLAPTVENRLLLAASALRFEEPPFPLTTKTLEDLREAAAGQTSFHVVSADRAIRLNLLPEAEVHLQEAMRLEPSNQVHALNLAVVRLQSAQTNLAVEARTQLERLSIDPQYGVVALRSLTAESFNRKDWAAASQYSRRVLAHTNLVFEDRIRHLSILREAQSEEGPTGARSLQPAEAGATKPGSKESGSWSADCESYLQSLKRLASTNVGNIVDLGTWLNRHEKAGEVVAWIKAMPVAVLAQQPVQLLLADAYMIQKDWRTLQTWLGEQKWDVQEFVRYAVLARACRNEEGGAAEAQVNWGKAVQAASERSELLAALANLAQSWGWTNETEEVLWDTGRKFPDELWAEQALEKALYRNGNTRGLFKLYSSRVERNPQDLLAMNDMATISMLLKTNLDKAHALARELYARQRTNLAFASTYAFSLYLQGKTDDGLVVLENLKEEDLRRGSMPVYYGALLNAVGNTQKAATYRALGEGAVLLPEERQLLK